MNWIATTGYGIEGVLAREIRDLGYPTADIQTSRVTFKGDAEAGVRANLWLRTAGHVRLEAACFDAADFNTLYDAVYATPWADLLPRDASFPVSCRLVNAAILSVPDTQAIVKKAISASLGRHYGLTRMPENGPVFPIEVHIYRNRVSISIDTSGEPLHKRGYRVLNPEAALRESLAATLVLMAQWHPGLPFADPFCGSGTICIEAAMMAKGIAPGLSRSFAAEQWGLFPEPLWRNTREDARSRIHPAALPLWGGDTDPAALSMARTHARRAGVEDAVRFEQADARLYTSDQPYGHLITNPPYGKRLSDEKTVQALYGQLRPMLLDLPRWSFHILASDAHFESLVGIKAHRKRVLYNGSIICRYYEYWGPRPPRYTAESSPLNSEDVDETEA